PLDARWRHFATGSNIKVSKTKENQALNAVVSGPTPCSADEPCSKRLGTAESGQGREEEGVGA
ncbi:hypothetical protein, partial [Mesorhizobium sp. M7A.F.Ca.US.005.03.2.1]|uniref:hypothetical protein n=1 Tax=Mesorhizobium sp. M7A.F.Ca.US.005.03.2.1 TaxID=2496737 RepID=UPI0019CFF8C8